MTEQVIFTNEDGEDIRFYVVEETKIAGVNYLLVTEQEDADSEACITVSYTHLTLPTT